MTPKDRRLLLNVALIVLALWVTTVMVLVQLVAS